MKNPLMPTLALTLLPFAVQAEENQPQPRIEVAPVTGSAKAIVTLRTDDGKTITREVKTGNATEIKVSDPNIILSTAVDAADDSAPVAGRTFLFNDKGLVTPREAPAGPWLGVAADTISEDIRAQLPPGTVHGLIIQSVVPDSPAAKAALQKNDILLKLDDQLLINAEQLKALVASKKEGNSVRLTSLRQGQEKIVEVPLTLRPENAAAEGPDRAFRHLRLDHKGADVLKPLFLQSRAVVVDPAGKVITPEGTSSFSFSMDGEADLAQATKTLTDAIAKAGLPDEVLKNMESSLDDALKNLKIPEADPENDTAAEEIKALKDQAAALQKALEKANAAVEEARKAAPQPKAE